MMGESHKLLVIGTVGVLCILPIINGASLTSPAGPTHKCMDKDCQVGRLEIAAEMMKYLDDTVDPCDNFLKYACGNWKETLSNSEGMMRAVKNAMKEEMIPKTTGEETSKAHRLIHDFYSTCMDDGARGDKPLELFKSMVMDSWPPTAGEKWNEADFCWMDWIGKTKQAGFTNTPFIDWEPQISPADVDTMRHRLHMPRNLFQFKANAVEDDYNKPYSDYMTVAARLLGATDENSEKELAPAYEFEKKLYAATLKRNSGEQEYETIEDMQREFPGIDWAKFLEKTLTPFVDPGHKTIITVENPAALKKFIKLMNKTPKRVLASYAIWKEFQFAMPYLTEEFKEVRRHFLNEMEFSEMPRNDFCTGLTKNFVRFAIEDWSMEQFSDSKKLIEGIVAMLKVKMMEMAQESKVLTDNEKNKAVEILTALNYTIGRSRKFEDRNELNAFYADATVDKENFLQTLMNMNTFLMKKENSQKVYKEVMQVNVTLADRFSAPKNLENHLFIPFSMIPSPIFNEVHPFYVNFGTAGSLIARTMFMSLTNLGMTWADQKANPNDQMKCFKALGQNVTDRSIKDAYEELIMDDVIGQYFGFRAAYHAYKQFTVEIGPELGLPGLPYTTDQLFWLSFAHSNCNFRPESDDLPFAAKDYNFIDYLTIIIMKNVPEIAEAFDCPVGSNMNSAEKCTWW